MGDAGAQPRGFLLDRGRFTRIDVPGAAQTQAFGINARGVVVGEYTDSAGKVHGFRWDRGRFTTVDIPGAALTSVADINSGGQMVGVYADPTGAVHGFLLDGRDLLTVDVPGVAVTFPFGINDRRDIVGFTFSDPAAPPAGAFLRRKGTFTSVAVPGAARTTATEIGNHGQIIGSYDNRNAVPSPESVSVTKRSVYGLLATRRPVD